MVTEALWDLGTWIEDPSISCIYFQQCVESDEVTEQPEGHHCLVVADVPVKHQHLQVIAVVVEVGEVAQTGQVEVATYQTVAYQRSQACLECQEAP